MSPVEAQLDAIRARVSRIEWLLSMFNIADIKHALLAWESETEDGAGGTLGEDEAADLAKHLHDHLGRRFTGIAAQPTYEVTAP